MPAKSKAEKGIHAFTSKVSSPEICQSKILDSLSETSRWSGLLP
jgi:hypothetical protein